MSNEQKKPSQSEDESEELRKYITCGYKEYIFSDQAKIARREVIDEALATAEHLRERLSTSQDFQIHINKYCTEDNKAKNGKLIETLEIAESLVFQIIDLIQEASSLIQ